MRANSSFDVIACLIDPLAIERIATEADMHAAPNLHGHLGVHDEALAPQIERVGNANMQVYGANKVWLLALPLN